MMLKWMKVSTTVRDVTYRLTSTNSLSPSERSLFLSLYTSCELQAPLLARVATLQAAPSSNLFVLLMHSVYHVNFLRSRYIVTRQHHQHHQR